MFINEDSLTAFPLKMRPNFDFLEYVLYLETLI